GLDRHVDDPEGRRLLGDAEAFGAEHGADEHVDVVLLGGLGGEVDGFSRVGLGVVEGGLERLAVDATRGVDLGDGQIDVDVHLGAFDGAGAGYIVEHADLDGRARGGLSGGASGRGGGARGGRGRAGTGRAGGAGLGRGAARGGNAGGGSGAR